MLKGVGFTDADLDAADRVATTWIETMPCNLNTAARGYVKQGIRAAEDALEFNTIAVSDGVTWEPRHARIVVSREVIADSIELVARGTCSTGIVCIVGCDKTIPPR